MAGNRDKDISIPKVVRLSLTSRNFFESIAIYFNPKSGSIKLLLKSLRKVFKANFNPKSGSIKLFAISMAKGVNEQFQSQKWFD